MSLEVFLELTPKEFFEAVKNREEYDGYAVKAIIRPLCDVIRLQTQYLFNISVPRKDRVKDPKKLMQFSWDYESRKEPQTYEEMKAVMKAIAKGSKQLKDKEHGKNVRNR